MITNQNLLGRKLRSLALRLFWYLENNNNTNFATNGEKVFIDNLFNYFYKMNQDRTILFDIGANIGDYTKMFLDKSTQRNVKVDIHVFEPTHSCFDILKNRFVKADHIILNKMAVSDREGATEIFYDQMQSGFASFYKRNLSAYSIQMNQSEIVETILLVNYIEEKGIDHIHFLKIDIEGHEMAALRGMGKYFSEDFVDFIQFEYGGTNLDSHTSLMELYVLFEKAGFILAKIMPKGLDIRSYSPWMDNFQYANYVAISAKIRDRLT